MEEKLKQETIKGMLWQYWRKAKGQSINFICLFALTAIIYLFALTECLTLKYDSW